jgi:hypothetical protein
MGLLDEAITKVTIVPRNRKMDRILAALADWDELDQLLDLLAAPIDQAGHKAMAGIIGHVCDQLGIDHERVNEDNVKAYREDLERQRGGS